jgi:hypothetical protein
MSDQQRSTRRRQQRHVETSTQDHELAKATDRAQNTRRGEMRGARQRGRRVRQPNDTRRTASVIGTVQSYLEVRE